ncbi:MAG: YabP/YqfC family sporulation protein [Clostridia bacterium]|nr:YabP/YqfC family sporulation protein [Clostridia bacterium]
MMQDKEKNHLPHSLILDGRERGSVTGVLGVLAYDARAIRMKTAGGELVLQGEGLHIENLSVECGELSFTGRVDTLAYRGVGERQSLLSRLFG